MPVIWYRPDLPLTVQQSYVLTGLFKSTVTEQIGKRKKLSVFSSSLFGCVVLFPSFSQPWTPENLLFFPKGEMRILSVESQPLLFSLWPSALISLLTSKEMIVGFFFCFFKLKQWCLWWRMEKIYDRKRPIFKKNIPQMCVNNYRSHPFPQSPI